MTTTPPDNQRPKCPFLDCFFGMGLAGRGQCPGEPDNPKCPQYKNEDKALRDWKERERTNDNKL